ncbi:MAG: hypothetical protein IKM43_01700 [Clostridia bacterium]|nr:hypothetical protein [Clostridia bacterium]
MNKNELLIEFYTKVAELQKDIYYLKLNVSKRALKTQEIRLTASQIEQEFYSVFSKVKKYLSEDKQNAVDIRILRKEIEFYKYYIPTKKHNLEELENCL